MKRMTIDKSESCMKKIKRIVSGNGKTFVDIVEHQDGSYSLQCFVWKFDAEESKEYLIRSLPDPTGRFADLASAVCEAKRLMNGEQ